MKKPLVHVLLDRSGSMQSIREETVTLFNGFVEDHPDARFSLTLFDSEGIDTLFEARHARKMKALTTDDFVPRGMTPLYDAIGVALERTNRWLKGQNGKKRRVMFVILTDGLENFSKDWTAERIRSRIAELEESGWQFIYLGANQDAWAVGQTIGVHNTVEYSADSQSMVAARASTQAVRSAYLDHGVQTFQSKVDVKSEGHDDG